MALGAFLAGLLLAETEFSLQVESDIAPYRGLLLGLFFMTVRNMQRVLNWFFLWLFDIHLQVTDSLLPHFFHAIDY